ncbi:MAG: hypothetical protein PUB97_01895 [Ruminococcus sp.]|nr:hypothetical protein [Ruminococcus sp.]
MMEASYLLSLNMLTPTIGALIARARFSEMGWNPRFLRGDEHPERTIFGPAEIGLISGIPIVIAAAVILYIANKNEKLQYEEI